MEKWISTSWRNMSIKASSLYSGIPCICGSYMDIRRGMFQVEHFRNSTRARLLLERVRSLEGSAGEFHAGRRVFWESALRHLHSHYPYPFPCRSESFSFPLSLSLSFLLPHPFTIPLQSIAAAKRGAKDGFRYRKDRE